jgi:hypothetical protein
MLNKKCLWCNKEYTPKTKYSNFCNRKCSINNAVDKRRRKLKALLVEYKGGKCEFCGYNKSLWALQFHHTKPEEKDFGISAKGNTHSLTELKLEVDKCLLLCNNCHAETHEQTDKETKPWRSKSF